MHIKFDYNPFILLRNQRAISLLDKPDHVPYISNNTYQRVKYLRAQCLAFNFIV